MTEPAKNNENPLSEAIERVERLTREVALLQSRISLLEAENARYAEMLTAKGIPTRARSRVALELPPPIESPIARDNAAFAGMDEAERRLLDECRAGGLPVFFLARSDSSVDTGAWLKKSRVWIAALGSELALFAAGKRPWLAKIPFANLGESFYNHVTGELALAPAAGLSLSSFKLSPRDGYQALAQIYKETKEK